MNAAQARLEAMLAMSIYKARSEDIKICLAELSEAYEGPETTVREVRAMMDRALGDKTLSGEIYKMREDAF